mgnify:CR=1 FL=1
MYRIHFEPHGGYFCIQILFLNFIWVDVKRPSSNNNKIEILKFPDLESARTEVKEIGLDVLYEDRSADKYRRHMQGGNHAVQHV